MRGKGEKLEQWWLQFPSSLCPAGPAKAQPGLTGSAHPLVVCVEFLIEFPLKICFQNTRVDIIILVKLKALCSLFLFIDHLI